MTTATQLTDHEIDLGVRLLQASEEDTFSFLGIQAERLEISQTRTAQGRSVPAWSNDDAEAKVLSGQRASKEELHRYFNKGAEFARNLITKLEAQLRGVLCDGTAVRPEILGLQDDTKKVIQYVGSLMVGVLLTSLPGAVAAAVTSIAATLAVVLIKRNINEFCTVGAPVVA
jgi:hypothetical protein